MSAIVTAAEERDKQKKILDRERSREAIHALETWPLSSGNNRIVYGVHDALYL
jgi:hypothetical protein